MILLLLLLLYYHSSLSSFIIITTHHYHSSLSSFAIIIIHHHHHSSWLPFSIMIIQHYSSFIIITIHHHHHSSSSIIIIHHSSSFIIIIIISWLLPPVLMISIKIFLFFLWLVEYGWLWHGICLWKNAKFQIDIISCKFKVFDALFVILTQIGSKAGISHIFECFESCYFSSTVSTSLSWVTLTPENTAKLALSGITFTFIEHDLIDTRCRKWTAPWLLCYVKAQPVVLLGTPNFHQSSVMDPGPPNLNP